jgi:hypothetical protein
VKNFLRHKNNEIIGVEALFEPDGACFQWFLRQVCDSAAPSTSAPYTTSPATCLGDFNGDGNRCARRTSWPNIAVFKIGGRRAGKWHGADESRASASVASVSQK